MANNKNCINNFRLPAEWEPQSGIQLTWPHANTDWKPYLEDITKVFVNMAKVITNEELLTVVTPETETVRKQLSKELTAAQLNNVIFYDIDSNDTWARDHAPLTLVSDDKETCILDFKFNGWGDKFEWTKDNNITSQLNKKGAFNSGYECDTDFVLEGGSIESDGKGSIFTTTFCLMAEHRNQPLTREEIEERLLKSLHAKRIVWLDYGQLIGDDTDGHIDTIVRLAPNDTIVYNGCDDESDEQYNDFNSLEEQLRQLKTLDGEAYNLLRLPMPDAIYDDGERLPATYANFVITNKSVICPTYSQPIKDNIAMKVLQRAFPNHNIVGIDASVVIKQHGSLHCLTMQYPEGTLKTKSL
jgi:Peptidylarginine deiminase and related enzymes